jgi:hypothetical protein
MTGTPPPLRRGAGWRHAWLRTAAACVGLTALLTACAGAAAAPVASPGAFPSTVAESTAPVAASGDVPSPELSLTPIAPWPTDIIDATIALGVLDNQVKLAGSDLATGVAERDLAQVLGASDGLAALVTQALPDALKLTTWPDTNGVGTAYLTVLTAIGTAATQTSAALREGDTEAFVTGMQDLGGALQQYQSVRVAMVDLVDKALQMRHMLLQ